MLIEAQGVSKSFYQEGKGLFRTKTQVLHEVSLGVDAGECVGLIGESGSGKSTLGRTFLGVEKPDQGKVLFEGVDMYEASVKERFLCRRRLSAVFQDYTSSVNPHFSVADILKEPLRIQGRLQTEKEDCERMVFLLEKVGLNGDYLNRYSRQLSGGQLQRVCIARALMAQPEFLLLDEPVSSLDVSVQVQVLDLLALLQEEMKLSYLFISHDLAAVAYFCQRAAFFYQGRIVEEVASMERLGLVRDEYARKLLHSVLDINTEGVSCYAVS